jgi:choline-glycine betaine transporter
VQRLELEFGAALELRLGAGVEEAVHRRGLVGDIAKRTAADINSAFFATLDHFPMATVTSVVAIILVLMFFISGADANTYVLGMMTCDGTLIPRRAVLILWGVLTGITAVGADARDPRG